MISNRELKDEIDQLTEQNQQLNQELKEIKDLMQQQLKQNSGSNNQNNQNSNNQNSGGSQQNNQNNQSGSSNDVSNIANDFSKLKDMTSQLETKLQQYISKNSNSKSSSLSQEDVINLILNMMNGMIDWTTDFVSKQNKQANQSQ